MDFDKDNDAVKPLDEEQDMMDNLQVFEKSTYDFDVSKEDQRQSEVFGSVLKRISDHNIEDSYVVRLESEVEDIPRH